MNEQNQGWEPEPGIEDTIAPEQLSGAPGSLLAGRSTEPVPVELKGLFLGPKGENAEPVERLLLQVWRDHVYWRRNFHPEDPPAISPVERHSPEFLRFWGHLEQELASLLGQLKADIPVFSPRYIGHMTSEITLPGILGYIAAMLYNPNNVSWEASPITTLLEIQVGRQLARMFGMGSTEEELEGTWGHITSGGTIANLESIWVAKAVKFLPLAIREAASELDLQGLTTGPHGKPIREMTAWELANLLPSEALDLRTAFFRTYLNAHPRVEPVQALTDAGGALRAHEILSLGDHAFFERLQGDDRLGAPLLCVPQTMHYSWEKGPGVFGIGSSQVVPIPIDRHYRINLEALREALEEAREHQRPILQVVGVVGTTEEGAVDPIHRLAALQEEMAAGGLGFSLHCDAAYGGYFAACLRDHESRLRPLGELQQEYGGWPDEEVYRALTAMNRADSITVDPHKTGYVPYAAGAVVFRDGRCKELVAQEAPYALGGREPGHPSEIYIGKYILEGSKAGAAAASVYLSHRVTPLDQRGYGLLLGGTCAGARLMYEKLLELAFELREEFLVAPLVEPDTNIVDYLFNIAGNRNLERMNRFATALYGKLSIDPERPIQTRRFLVSHTEFGYRQYNPAVVREFLGAKLGIDPDLFISPEELNQRKLRAEPGFDSSVMVFRTTLMNPFVGEEVRPGKSYLDLFLQELPVRLRHARSVLEGQGSPGT